MIWGPPSIGRGSNKKAVGGPWLELQKGLSGDPPSPHPQCLSGARGRIPQRAAADHGGVCPNTRGYK